jgi:hypothetical protein
VDPLGLGEREVYDHLLRRAVEHELAELVPLRIELFFLLGGNDFPVLSHTCGGDSVVVLWVLEQQRVGCFDKEPPQAHAPCYLGAWALPKP